MRVAVIGSSACGKTTFAKTLSHQTGLRHIELDALYWGPNWTPVPDEVFSAAVLDATAGPEWVCDGNYAAVRDIVWQRAQTLIWLNYSFPLVLYRAASRTLTRLVKREELFAGNRESLRLVLDPDWIPWWVIRTFHARRRRYRALLGSEPCNHLRVVEFQQPEDAASFLSNSERFAFSDPTQAG